MRHRKKFNHLGRTSTHRKAMLSNMASSLILHKRISTTTAKAKALKVFVEPLITKSKDDSTHSRRIVFSKLKDKNAVSELFREVSPKVADRPGGYTRILKTGTRLGDNSDMCIIELVDFNENLLSDKAAGKAKRSRRRGGKKSTAATSEAKEAVAKETSAEASTDDVKDATAPVEEAPATEAKTEEAPQAEEKSEEKPATDESEEKKEE